MSRVESPVIVGNDIVIDTNRPVRKKPEPVKIRRDYVFPSVQEKAPKPRYQQIGALAFNAQVMAGQTQFFTPSLSERAPKFFGKIRLMYVVMAVTFICLSALILTNGQRIVALAHGFNSITRQLTGDVTHHQSVAPVSSPRQLIIHNSDYDSAMTALITQRIIFNVGNSSQTANGTAIASWINAKSQDSLTTLSVNTSALRSYLNHLMKVYGQTTPYSSAVFNQIANNLLKAKGLNATL